jgi:hypothetical protein
MRMQRCWAPSSSPPAASSRLDPATPTRPHRLHTAINDGDQISVSGIARAAGVDRSFLYHHRELLEQVHAAAAQPQPPLLPGPRSPEPPYRPT